MGKASVSQRTGTEEFREGSVKVGVERQDTTYTVTDKCKAWKRHVRNAVSEENQVFMYAILDQSLSKNTFVQLSS